MLKDFVYKILVSYVNFDIKGLDLCCSCIVYRYFGKGYFINWLIENNVEVKMWGWVIFERGYYFVFNKIYIIRVVCVLNI